MMHSLTNAILGVYREDPHAQLTTSELVARVFPYEYAAIRSGLKSADHSITRAAKREKARLHRRLLHHINVLVARGALRVSDVRARGEHVYTLALSSGEMIFHGSASTVTIVRPQKAQNYITEAEEEGLVYTRSAAAHKVDAYAIDGALYDSMDLLLTDLRSVIAHCNDAIGIYNFAHLIQEDPDGVEDAFEALIELRNASHVCITLHTRLAELPAVAEHLQLLTTFVKLEPRRTYFIFAGSYAELHEHHATFERIAALFGSHGKKLMVQNTDTDSRPYILGRAGMYAANIPRGQKNTRGFVVCAASYAIDLGKKDLPASQLKTLTRQAAKTLIARADAQQRDLAGLFPGLQCMGPLWLQTAVMESYIRFWGPEWSERGMDLLEEIHEDVTRFCTEENKIFSAASTALKCRISLSSAFPHYHTDLSERQYRKKPVYDRRGLDENTFMIREQLCRTYACDRVRVFRDGDWKGSDLVNEIIHVLHAFEIPLITYDFTSLRQTVTLKHFL